MSANHPSNLSDRERQRRNRQRELSRILRQEEVLAYTGLSKSANHPSDLSDRERQRRNRQRQLSRILRQQDVLDFTGLSKSQIAAMVARGQFPQPIKLSEGGRAKGWFETELIDWQERRAAARDAA